MKINLKKIDAVIVAILIITAGIVLYSAGYINPQEENKKVTISKENQQVEKTNETEKEPAKLPKSIIPGFARAVSPTDEGKHYHNIRICREWWYYTVVFNENSDLAGWTATISFNHMARGDLLGTLKPDMLVMTLHGPNGEEYGGIINKKRGLGLIKQPTLQAKTPGVNIEFEDSWVEGQAPQWHIHVEDNKIDKQHKIIIDLDFFAPSDPIWTIGERAFQKSKSNIANYMFTGCNVTGTVKIDGRRYTVKGTGHHEHSWTPRIVNKKTIKEWDWCYATLENGWNIYFSNYKSTHNIKENSESNFNPFGTMIITTDQGETLTLLENMDVTVEKSEKTKDKVFLFVKMPSEITINAETGMLQPLLKSSNIELTLEIKPENTVNKVWKLPTYVGMKIGRSQVEGKISWIDDEGEKQQLKLNGIGNTWNMRALI